jgi:nucleoid DNA-binding protein|tara:strand:+ start:2596 stop:2832 length:237 start_codon:yes stop_codon:yes gene_type:complete
MKKNKKELIYYLANKYNLPLKTIDRMVNYQFKYVSKIMSIGNFEGIRIPYFGLFSVNPNRVKYLTQLKNKKDNATKEK